MERDYSWNFVTAKIHGVLIDNEMDVEFVNYFK